MARQMANMPLNLSLDNGKKSGMEAEQTNVKAYCNVLALEKGLDPVGYAGSFDDAILVETSLPWKQDIYQQAGALPQEIINLLTLWLQRYHETGEYRHRPLLIAPDVNYSRPGFRRVLYYTRSKGACAHFDKIEYSIPDNEVGALAWALFESDADLSRFEPYRLLDVDITRDILICTHGTVDAACAKFGYPLYKDLRRNYANNHLRVWRVSHFGGHVFAPTMMDMPTGHYWAYVEETQARQIVERSGDVAALRGHYRGWAGLTDGFIQAAERELWQRYGWAWFSYPKSGNVLAQDSNRAYPLWAEVQIAFELPDDPHKTARMRVEVQRHIETVTTTGYEQTYNYPQYSVTQLEVLP